MQSWLFTGVVSPSMQMFVIMRRSYPQNPHKGRGGALNGDTKNSCKGDHTSSLRVATPFPRQRGEGVATHGLAFCRRSLSPFFLWRGKGAVTRRLPHQLHKWMQPFKRPFYSCGLYSILAFERMQGWSWPCTDTDLLPFLMEIMLIKD